MQNMQIDQYPSLIFLELFVPWGFCVFPFKILKENISLTDYRISSVYLNSCAK